MVSSNEDTFVTKKVSNQDIYDAIGKLNKQLDTIEKHVAETNGKVRMNRILIAGVWTAIGAIGATIGWIMNRLFELTKFFGR